VDVLQINEVFLERKFELYDTAGKVTNVTLRVGKPQQKAVYDWSCPFQIVGIGDEKIQIGSGVDSLHALLLGLQLAQTLLKYFARQEQKKITWLNSDDLGFSIK